jgi:protein-histidine pros-kinase
VETTDKNDDESVSIQSRWNSAARAIRDESELFAQIIESLPDGLVLVDNDGKIDFINRQAELLFGYSRYELIGEEHAKLIPSNVRDLHDEHRINYQRDPHVRSMGMAESAPLMGLHKDGSNFPVDIMLAPIVGRKGIYTVAVLRKVSK